MKWMKAIDVPYRYAVFYQAAKNGKWFKDGEVFETLEEAEARVPTVLACPLISKAMALRLGKVETALLLGQTTQETVTEYLMEKSRRDAAKRYQRV